MSWQSTMRSTISAAVLATMLAGCASSPSRVASSKGFGGRTSADLGLATRALAALSSNQLSEAVTLAERAVAKTPADAGFRTLLGNAYFASGRFVSAEQAYRDALALYPNQPQSMLKLALVQIAQGKRDSALATLEAGRGVLDPADLGLALALAGQPNDAISVLDYAARSNGADARVRQNLALAYALAGDWLQARTIAAQDVPGEQLDARIAQWTALANPEKPSDQVAALVGVVPVADSGQPVGLALVKDNGPRLAEATPVAPMMAAAPEVAPAPPAPVMPAAPVAEALSAEAVAALPAVEVARHEPSEPAPAFADAGPVAPPAPDPVRVVAENPAEAPLAMVEVARQMLPKVRAEMAESKARPAAMRASAPRAGKSVAVVQLGAYSNPAGVQQAWDSAARKFASLRDYSPMSARFVSPKGTVYRLSVKGFDSRAEAADLCASLKRSGRACFVRTVAGDKPIQLASR